MERRRLLAISHCVMSRRMRGLNRPPQAYYLADYHGQKQSPTIHTDLPNGEVVTVARLTKDAKGLILTVGAVEASLDEPGLCRNTLLVNVPDMKGLMRLVRGVQYHLVVACGDHREKLARLAERADAEVKAV